MKEHFHVIIFMYYKLRKINLTKDTSMLCFILNEYAQNIQKEGNGYCFFFLINLNNAKNLRLICQLMTSIFHPIRVQCMSAYIPSYMGNEEYIHPI